MCGIIGIVSNDDVVNRIIEGLSRLEYRGYDSAGIATLNNQTIQRQRAAGKLQALREEINTNPIHGSTGIGHTRWATHGKPSTNNAHPHATDRVAVVHNGIIENYQELKANLIKKGICFESETDTEVVVHLIDEALQDTKSPLQAVQQTLEKLHGAFALAIIFKDHPNLLIGARRGSPLVLGIRENELFLGSDAWALAPWTNTICYLEEGDVVALERNQNTYTHCIYNDVKGKVGRPVKILNLTAGAASKGEYNHYMLKEIFEQPQTISETILSLVDSDTHTLKNFINIDFSNLNTLHIIACGSSYYVSLLGKYWLEKYARIPVNVELASEFRYRDPVLAKNDLAIFVSQSGETSDTLAALNLAKEYGCQTLAIINVPESSIMRAANHHILTQAGPEIGVASTKAFTAQMAVLLTLALKAAQQRNTLTSENIKEHIHSLLHIPKSISNVLSDLSIFDTIGLQLTQAHSALFIGRGTNFPVALEGALKLKEISYIHAEAYAAGELKHGPIALVDEATPVIAIIPNDTWFEKTLSNVQEVAARGGPIIAITDTALESHIPRSSKVIKLLNCSPLTQPFLLTIAIQCLAYYTALHKGTDVDQPRNLAKSVTVE